MCRALSYLGPPVPIRDLLYQPDSSLIRQSIDPRHLHMLNLAGFGMMSWNAADAEPDEPLVYRTTTVPVYDANLASLARKLETTCLLAHVRGVAYRPDAGFGDQNLHPFRYPGARIALAHNGDLAGFSRMKSALHARLAPSIAPHIRGTTDSEWLYALFLSQLDDPGAGISDTTLPALEATLRILRALRTEVGIDTSSSVNLFLTDGTRQLAARFTFDFGRYPLDPLKVHEANSRFLSLWYTLGAGFEPADGTWRMTIGPARAAIMASEPLTRDDSSWVEVPEYGAVLAEQGVGGTLHVSTAELDA